MQIIKEIIPIVISKFLVVEIDISKQRSSLDGPEFPIQLKPDAIGNVPSAESDSQTQSIRQVL